MQTKGSIYAKLSYTFNCIGEFICESLYVKLFLPEHYPREVIARHAIITLANYLLSAVYLTKTVRMCVSIPGRRSCPGENLARTEVFLFTAALLQNFDISSPLGAPLTGVPDELPYGLRLPKEKTFVYSIRQ